ncbi:hypothetical protein GE09DRAFT_459331 [Coniochaeta sp. 2T2.1]|nr:hypothetical protein GE09DRAFT_459331 [Coniochaeta sp. 2T2.1]
MTQTKRRGQDANLTAGTRTYQHGKNLGVRCHTWDFPQLLRSVHKNARRTQFVPLRLVVRAVPDFAVQFSMHAQREETHIDGLRIIQMTCLGSWAGRYGPQSDEHPIGGEPLPHRSCKACNNWRSLCGKPALPRGWFMQESTFTCRSTSTRVDASHRRRGEPCSSRGIPFLDQLEVFPQRFYLPGACAVIQCQEHDITIFELRDDFVRVNAVAVTQMLQA